MPCVFNMESAFGSKSSLMVLNLLELLFFLGLPPFNSWMSPGVDRLPSLCLLGPLRYLISLIECYVVFVHSTYSRAPFDPFHLLLRPATQATFYPAGLSRGIMDAVTCYFHWVTCESLTCHGSTKLMFSNIFRIYVIYQIFLFNQNNIPPANSEKNK